MSQILLVEDDPILGRGLKLNLEFDGHQVSWARDLRNATAAESSQPFDLIILDLGLPDGSGLNLCSKLREHGSRIPIIILTAKVDEDSVVAGLTAGANDYIRKPFGKRELLARVRTALHAPTTREDQVRLKDILVLKGQRKVMHGSVEIELNRREFDILSFLIDRAEMVVTREQIMDALDKTGEILDRTLDSHLSHIRRKLRNANVHSIQISSVYGVGYRLEEK
jgi:DNA-binding response OmpR family regulator